MGWPQLLGVSLHVINPYFPLQIQRFPHIMLYLDNILILFSLDMWKRGHDNFCAVYWFVFGYTLIFSSLFWDMVDTVSLPSDKLEIQQLDHSLLQT